MTATFPVVNNDISFVKLRLDARTASLLEAASGRLVATGAVSLQAKVSKGKHNRLQAPGITLLGIYGSSMKKHAAALKELERMGEALPLRFSKIDAFSSESSPHVDGRVLMVSIEPSPMLVAFKQEAAEAVASAGFTIYDPHSENWQPHCSLAVIPNSMDLEKARYEAETVLADRGFSLPAQRRTRGLYVQAMRSPLVLNVESPAVER